MARIDPAIRRSHGLMADLIPVDVLKSIDQAELLDRLAHVTDLTERARSSADPTLRRGYSAVAKAVLTARPRARVAQEHAQLVAKAAGLGNTGAGDAARREAEQLLTENPPAPERGAAVAVAKAKALAGDGDDLIICYDESGKPYGVCPRSALQPVTTDIAKAGAGKGRPVRAARRLGRG